VLPTFVPEENRLALALLGPHNSAVSYDEFTKKLSLLVYSTGHTDSGDTFRVWSAEFIQDIEVDRTTGQEKIVEMFPNPYGMIPLAVFHDTNTPREGFFNPIARDLVCINDVYNVHLSDSEYSLAWAKYETLFTNATVVGSDSGAGVMMPVQMEGEALPRLQQTMGATAIGGAGKVIMIDTNGVDSPFVEYKGPKPDLAPLDDMVKKWVIDFAAYWSVNAGADVNAADSGFKLVVKEMPNLELRKKRQRMMEAGFSRLFKAIRGVVNYTRPGTFSDDADLFVSFGAPELPVDEKMSEEIWSMKIDSGRASRLDYFMVTQGLTQEEAALKVAEIDRFTSGIVTGVA